MEKLKVVIIGSGPSGVFCALGLDKDKFEVTIFDKKEFPRDKTCGDAISIDAVKTIKDFDISIFNEISEKKIAHEVSELAILLNNKLITKLRFEKVDKNHTPIISSRFNFDHLLQQKLLNTSGIICKNKNIISVEEMEGGVELKMEDNSIEKFDLVVFATGSTSLADRFTSKKIQTANFYGIRQYVKNFTFPTNTMYFIFDKNKLPSYYWIFPLSENTFNIGVYFDKKSKPLLNKSDSILDYFKKVGVLSDFTENAEEISKPVAYHIPFNSKVSKNLIGNKYIVIGTSAGLTDPITGEGIGQAIKSGIIASKILNRIDTDFIDFIQQGEYIKELQKQITNKTKQSRKIQRLFSIKGITVISFFMIRNFIFVNWLFSNTNRIRSFLNNKS